MGPATDPSGTVLPGPLRAHASAARDERMAAGLGIALGVTFTICFATGMLSHLIQDPPAWFTWPTRPVWGYRFTQGLHVATGLATIPLLLAKLWVVLPKFFSWPVVTSVDDAVRRAADGVLVGGGLFLVVSGVGNIYVWRPWGFAFTSGHFWAAVAAFGAMLVHLAHHGRPARRALRGPGPAPTAAPAGRALTRRGFVATVVGATGLLTVTTLGQTLPPFRFLNALGPRRPTLGPQGLPVNTSAANAGVTEVVGTDALLAGYRLGVGGDVTTPLELDLDDLRAMPQHRADLPIACVEGWSASATWSGVRVRDLLDRAGAPDGASVRVVSLQQGSRYAESDLHPGQARDPLTLLALDIGDEPLHIDHGRPVRLIGANRPGVQQTKWVTYLEVRA